jgi:hypothetical protein
MHALAISLESKSGPTSMQLFGPSHTYNDAATAPEGSCQWKEDGIELDLSWIRDGHYFGIFASV